MNRLYPRRIRRIPVASAIESLESRRLLHVAVLNPVADVVVATNAPATFIDLTNRYDNTDISGTVVKLDTTLGDLYLETLDAQKPNSTENFLSYVTAGKYDNTVIDRSGRLDQNASLSRQFLGAGSYTAPDLLPVSAVSPVGNEFNVNGVVSNVRGTVAFDHGGDPNSATSRFLINLANDSAFTSTQDAGQYTVFARIINSSMNVADAIAGVPFYQFPGTNFPEFPARDYTTYPDQLPLEANFIKINSAQVTPEYTHGVSSDNSALVSPVLSGNGLTLNYGSNQTGLANITVTLTSLDGAVTQDTFQVGVGQPVGTTVKLGVGGAKSVTYTDADGTVATLTLSRGSADLKFNGDGITTQAKGPRTIVSGTGLLLNSIDLAGTAGTGALSISAAKGNAQIDIALINSIESLKSITGKAVNVTGAMNIPGKLASLSLRSVGSFALGGSLASGRIYTNAGGISVGGGVRSLTVGSINGPVVISGNVTSLNLPVVNANVRVDGSTALLKLGSMTGDVQLGSVRSLLAKSMHGNLDVSGAAGSITLGSITGGHVLIGSSSDPRAGVTVSLGAVTDASFSSGIAVRSLKVTQWISTDTALESIDAPSLASLICTGNLAVNLSLSGVSGVARTLGSARIAGQLTGGSWGISGNVGSIIAGTILPDWSPVISGNLASFRTGGSLASNLDAGSIGSAGIAGDLTGNVITRSSFASKVYGLRSLIVGGILKNSFIQSSGNIGSITARGLDSSAIYAGIGPLNEGQTLPASISDFIADATITSVTVRGKGLFTAGSVAARFVGSLKLGLIETKHALQIFGVAGDRIKSVTGISLTDGAVTGVVKLTNLDAINESPFGDFRVRVL